MPMGCSLSKDFVFIDGNDKKGEIKHQQNPTTTLIIIATTTIIIIMIIILIYMALLITGNTKVKAK